MITLKSTREINLMKEAGRVLTLVFDELRTFIKPGVSTKQIDEVVERIITENDCIPTEKGYCGYPASSCVSVNDTILHGIPSDKIILKDGDIVSVDIVATYQGYSADACRTYLVGSVSGSNKRLVEVTKQAFFEAVSLIKPGVHLGDICSKVQKYVEANGYSVAKDYTGHGIGREMHEDPSIPNYGSPGKGIVLQEGMTICIEPMVLAGKDKTRVLSDGWTVKSRDGSNTAHYENTVVVTSSGYEIITMKEGEN